jgi:hypothetical protein
MHLATRLLPRDQRGWTGTELSISFGIIFAVMGMFIWVVVPTDRYRDARDARRREDAYAVLNAMLLKEKDEVEAYRGEAAAPLDDDATTAQVIVRRLGDGTCQHGLKSTPTCPGAVKSGLRLSTYGQGCFVLLDDDRYNAKGLVNRYLLSLPIDPSAHFTSSLQRTIQGLPLGGANTGYYINRGAEGRLEVGACQPEMSPVIREIR